MTKRVLQGRILARFMSAKALASLEQEYNDNRQGHRRAREVTQNDLLILSEYQKANKGNIYVPFNKFARDHKLTAGQLSTALRLAAMSKLK